MSNKTCHVILFDIFGAMQDNFHMHYTVISNSSARRVDRAATSPKNWTDAMLAELLQRMRASQSRELLAQLYGETPYRILKLKERAERLERRGQISGPFAGLDSYARNSLMGAGLTTAQQVRAALQDGSLSKTALLGPRRIEAIQQWLDCQMAAA